jgi:diguanylate cyclase (GGDEF)-like protein
VDGSSGFRTVVKDRGRSADGTLMRRGAAGLLAASVVLPVAGELAPGDIAASASYLGVAGTAALVALVAASRVPGRDRAAWVLLAAGVGAWVLGDLAWDAQTFATGEPTSVAVADALYLAGYPLLAAGILALVHGTRRRWPKEIALDGVALAAATAILAWAFLVVPADDPTSGMLARAVYAAYPIGDAVLLGALVWLLAVRRHPRGALTLLGIALGATLVADAAWAAIPLWAPSVSLAWVDVFYPASYAVFAAAVVARVRAGDVTGHDATDHENRLRWAFLGLALLCVPVIQVGTPIGETAVDRVVLLAAGVGISATVLTRFVLAVRERELARLEVSHQATHDGLTGLANRAAFMARLDDALARRRDEAAVLYVDLDGFKAVNDTWGHRLGDELLIEVAARLRAAVRPTDVVARLGGDEFVVLCEGVTDRATVLEIASRLLREVGRPVVLGTRHACVSAGVGVAFPRPADDAEALLRAADEALYAAKREGPGRYRTFDDLMAERSATRRELERDLAGALDRGELRLDYQPVVGLDDEQVVAVEALLRWDRPGVGIVGPEDFVPLAEADRTIVRIGAWVVSSAVRQVARWNDARLDRPPVGVAVNVSGHQLEDDDFVDVVAAALSDTGFDPALLTLEITETVLVSERPSVYGRLDALRRLGVRIAIDDFGTGYGTLSYLRRLPVDALKLDRQFVADLGGMAPETTVAAAVMAMARTLGLEVVAEGVETAEQARALRTLACPRAQGFLYSRPLPAAALERLLDRSRPALRASAPR